MSTAIPTTSFPFTQTRSERSYGSLNGEALTERKLARVLSRLVGGGPRSMRIQGEQGKGYERGGLAE